MATIFSAPQVYRGRHLFCCMLQCTVRLAFLIEKAWQGDRGLVVPTNTAKFLFLSAAELYHVYQSTQQPNHWRAAAG